MNLKVKIPNTLHMAKTVLIIDDVGFDRTIISALLRQTGYEVIGEASNGKEGMQKAIELQPDIISLDKRMPDMDGIAVLKELHSSGYDKDIVIISGDETDSIIDEAKSLGVNCILKKPVTRDTIRSEFGKI